jgi:glycosyltransferase involved in cell wall biosynthesis
MGSPRFTVVIPCFNGARYIEQALKSALEQSYPPEEILVIDDGSTDGSLEIARAFGTRVTCLEQAHQGPSTARNLGTARARGDFIAFLDADDVWMPEKLAQHARLIERRPELDLVYTGYCLLRADGSTEEVRARPPEWTRPRLKLECPIVPSTAVARTDLLRAERWSTSYGSSEDWDLLYRLSKVCKFGYIEGATIYYRQHPESLSTRNWKSVLENARRVSATIRRDANGLEAVKLKRRVEARLLFNAAIASRNAGSPEYLGNLLRSLAAWPLPLGYRRHRALGRMIVQRCTEIATRQPPRAR